MTTRAWIDAQGHIVRAENAVGFVMERTAFELATPNFRNRTHGSDPCERLTASGRDRGDNALGARATLPGTRCSLLRPADGRGSGCARFAGGRQPTAG